MPDNFTEEQVQEVLNKAYPVNCVYIGDNDPNDFLPGTWQNLTAGEVFLTHYSTTKTDGSDSQTLDSAWTPDHTHSLSSHTHQLGPHSHTVPAHTHSCPARAHSHATTNRSHVHDLVVGAYYGSGGSGNEGMNWNSGSGQSIHSTGNVIRYMLMGTVGTTSGSRTLVSELNTSYTTPSSSAGSAYESINSLSGSFSYYGSATQTPVPTVPPFKYTGMWRRIS